jgi:16S rRNA pseudouridine516 synthase
MKSAASVRIDRLLANLGYGSRTEAQALVAHGEVRLDGGALRDPGARVTVEPGLALRMEVAGAPLDPPPPLVIMLNKPLGSVCSHHEPGRSVHELLPERWRRRRPIVSTIGRLDLDTSGLLLLTDDGAFLHRIISPRRHVAKRYRVMLEQPLHGDEAALFASGSMRLEGDSKPLAASRLEVLGLQSAQLTITEGRYHQVRRMFAATGNRVVALHRDRIGALDLPADLAPGAWRLLGEDEQSRLF